MSNESNPINRRTFVKTTAGTAAAAAIAVLGSNVKPAQAREKSGAGKYKPITKVNCFSEDGELKEVIFGRVDDLRIDDYHPSYDFAGPKAISMMKKFGGKLFSEADPEWYKKVKDSSENAVDFLKSRGIVVHRPRENTKVEMANFALEGKININLYNRDSLVAIGNTLVETSFKAAGRLRNKYAVRNISMELMRRGNPVISMPQPLDTFEHNEKESPLVEGGDVEIDNGNIYIGNSGQAANSLGVLWFKNAFPDWNVHEIKVSSKRFPHQHLDCAMVIFKKWGCILVDDIIGGYDGLPKPLKEKKWIELTFEEATDKLANFIAINPEEVLMPTEAKRLRKEVEKLGIKVHHLPYYDVGKLGGSLRCNTCPIYRVG